MDCHFNLLSPQIALVNPFQPSQLAHLKKYFLSPLTSCFSLLSLFSTLSFDGKKHMREVQTMEKITEEKKEKGKEERGRDKKERRWRHAAPRVTEGW